MITPMSRVIVACTGQSREESLEALRNWGMLHIKPLKNPDSESVSTAKAALTKAQRAFESLPEKAEGSSVIPYSDLLEEIHTVLEEKKSAEETVLATTAELERVAHFGGFNPAKIRSLAEKGIIIKLYSASEKAYKPIEGNFAVQEFARKNGEVFFAVFGRERFDLPYQEIALPAKSTSELSADLKKANEILVKDEKKLSDFSSKRNELREIVLDAEDDLSLACASAGMVSEAGISFIQGYYPKENLDSLRNLARKNGWGISEEEPEKDEAVPTLLKHPKTVKPIDALYSIIGISPGYREIDISSVFLCFFSVFFAMIVGDAVYGLLLLGITVWASNKFKDSPRHVFHFLYLMSFCTIIWGVLSGDFLGLNVGDDKAMAIPAFLDLVRAPYSPDWLKNFASWVREDNNIKFLCFVLGVIHLSIARIWNAFTHFANEKPAFIVQIGWLFVTWTMFFLTCSMVLGKDMPQTAFYVGGVGVSLILVGNIIRKEWFGVGMIALDLVSSLTNIISYIRLFAVGMAGYAIANTFSNMVAPLFDSIPGIVAAIVILLFVHTLNLALCAMGVAVHAIRLNTLEFSSNVGVEWSGDPYIPFRKVFNHHST